MRKISTRSARHNETLVPAPAIVALLAVLLLTAGCGGEADDTEASAGTPAPAADGRVVFDTTAWDAFAALGERILAHEPVSREDLAAYGDLPAVAGWRATQPSPQPTALRVANWLEETFRTELGITDQRKRNQDRNRLSVSYRYSFDRRDEITTRLAALATDGYGERIADLVHRWVPADSIPTPLIVRFVPAVPELRIDNGVVYVDTGMYLAAGNDRLVRHVGALLYRRFAAPVGGAPHQEAGEEAIMQSMRAMTGEGVANWVEDLGHLGFRSDHPVLKRIHVVPEDMFTKGQTVIELLDERLPEAFADSAAVQLDGPALAGTLVARNAFIGTGWAMAATIVHHLGEDRLVAVRSSVPGFVAAFQEAALKNEKPSPPPGVGGVPLAECIPALDPDVYAELIARLEARFGAP